jgi:hypothetical protein
MLPDSLTNFMAYINPLWPDLSSHSPAFQKVYLRASELRRLRRSQGSPLLSAVLLALGEPLSCWTAEDLGVDEQGCYELLDPFDQLTCSETSELM